MMQQMSFLHPFAPRGQRFDWAMGNIVLPLIIDLKARCTEHDGKRQMPIIPRHHKRRPKNDQIRTHIERDWSEQIFHVIGRLMMGNMPLICKGSNPRKFMKNVSVNHIFDKDNNNGANAHCYQRPNTAESRNDTAAANEKNRE